MVESIKNKHIAVAYNDKGECLMVSKVKTITELEYKRLLNEQSRLEAEKLLQEKEYKDSVKKEFEDLKTQIGLLKKLLIHLFGYEELDEEEIKEVLGVLENEEE